MPRVGTNLIPWSNPAPLSHQAITVLSSGPPPCMAVSYSRPHITLTTRCLYLLAPELLIFLDWVDLVLLYAADMAFFFFFLKQTEGLWQLCIK